MANKIIVIFLLLFSFAFSQERDSTYVFRVQPNPSADIKTYVVKKTPDGDIYIFYNAKKEVVANIFVKRGRNDILISKRYTKPKRSSEIRKTKP